MERIELPHTKGCLVCGRQNPHGLHLHLYVAPDAGTVDMHLTTRVEHIGFDDIVHGGILATLADEAMAWSAIWASGRLCVAAEITIRFRQRVGIGEQLHVSAQPTRVRSKLVESECDIRNGGGEVVANASGKFMPLSAGDTLLFVPMLVQEPGTAQAFNMIKAHSEQALKAR